LQGNKIKKKEKKKRKEKKNKTTESPTVSSRGQTTVILCSTITIAYSQHTIDAAMQFAAFLCTCALFKM